MSLNGLKQLLLRKTRNDDGNLRTLIEHMDEEKLVGYVVDSMESLEKAHSKHHGNAGKNANSSVTHWLNKAHESEFDAFREALGHHASHYKAALKAGSNDVANKHMRKFFDIMHLMQRAHIHEIKESKESNKMVRHPNAPKLDAEHPSAWERNQYPESKGWNRKASIKPGSAGYEYLRSAPHGSKAKDIRSFNRHENNSKRGVEFHGAYPLEHVTLNDKHINVEDIESPGKFVGHVYDDHPVLQTHHVSADDYKDEAHDWFNKSFKEFRRRDDVLDIAHKYDVMREEDPEAYAAMGKDMSSPVHDQPEDMLDVDHAIENPSMYSWDSTKGRAKSRIQREAAGVAEEEKRQKPVDPKEIKDAKQILDNSAYPDELKGAMIKQLGLDHRHIAGAGHDPSKFGFEAPKVTEQPEEKSDDTPEINPAHEEIHSILGPGSVYSGDLKSMMIQSSGHSYDDIKSAGYTPEEHGIQPPKKEG